MASTKPTPTSTDCIVPIFTSTWSDMSTARLGKNEDRSVNADVLVERLKEDCAVKERHIQASDHPNGASTASLTGSDLSHDTSLSNLAQLLGFRHTHGTNIKMKESKVTKRCKPPRQHKMPWSKEREHKAAHVSDATVKTMFLERLFEQKAKSTYAARVKSLKRGSRRRVASRAAEMKQSM